MKALSPILSHTIFIALSVVVLLMISSMVFYLYSESVKYTIRAQLMVINQQIADEIIKLYKTAKESSLRPSANSSVLIERSELYLPLKVSNRKYTITLHEASSAWVYLTQVQISGANVSTREERPSPEVVTRTETPFVEASTKISNLEIELQGSVDGDRQPIVLEYYRYNFENNILDKVTIGQPNILISVEGIS